MAFHTAAGHNNLPNGNFIPEIWSSNFLARYYESCLYAKICNTDYEGEIKNLGDKVVIPRDPEIEVKEYVKGAGMETQTVEDEGEEFYIQRGLYYQFGVADVERVQTNPIWIAKASANATSRTAGKIDETVLGRVYVDTPAGNILGASTALTKDNVDKLIVDIGVAMDNRFIPRDDGNRWILLPYEVIGLLKRNENFNDASKMGDAKSMIRSGCVGEIDNAKIFGTSRLARTADGSWQVIAGHKHAVTFASQFVKTETLRNPNDFGDIVRGLQVYDWKVLESSFLFTCTAKLAA